MDETTTGGTDWASWFQGISQSAIGLYGNVTAQKNSQDFQLEQAKIQYLGQTGYYQEGQARTNSLGGISSGTLLLLVAAVAAILLLKD